jgi:hypothetical protein
MFPGQAANRDIHEMRGFVQLEPFGDGFTYGSKLENGFGLLRDAIRVA